METPIPIQEQEIEINLQDYLVIIRRRRWIIFTFFVVVVCAVTVWTFLQTPVFRATTTILIDEETPDVLAAKDGLSLGSPGYVSYREYYQTQLEIIKSRSIAKDVFSALALDKAPEYLVAKDPIKQFLLKLKVEPSRNTRLVYIGYEDKDKELATQAVNMIATVYSARNLVCISKNENVNLIKNEYLKLQAKYSEYTKMFKAKHPKMIQLKEEIAQLEDRMRKEEADPFKATGLKANNVRIIDAAEVPKSPVRPKKAQNILIAIIVGLVGGTGLAFLIEYMDNTIKTTDDVERYVKLPLLGYVPVIEKSFTELQKDRLVNIVPTSPVSVAYRSIRTAILFSSTEEKETKDILVTSAGPQEGKSLTACNLAITMAYSGNSVLLVDADMRKPRIHEVFKQEGDFGLSNFLTGQASLDEITKKTDIENLSVITCGHIPPNPSELLSTKRMKEFLDKVRQKYAAVIFDSPPVAVVTDAVILSGMIDGTVLVVNSKKTTRPAVSRAKQLLVNSKANVFGVILNNLHIERHHYYYSHYYYKDTGKREHKKKT
jgi:capsular exopolysaccharide synthesis family protein